MHQINSSSTQLENIIYKYSCCVRQWFRWHFLTVWCLHNKFCICRPLHEISFPAIQRWLFLNYYVNINWVKTALKHKKLHHIHDQKLSILQGLRQVSYYKYMYVNLYRNFHARLHILYLKNWCMYFFFFQNNSTFLELFLKQYELQFLWRGIQLTT